MNRDYGTSLEGSVLHASHRQTDYSASEQLAQDIITGLRFSALPFHLFLPDSTFPGECKDLIIRHLQAGRRDAALAVAEHESALWSNPNLVFFQCRIGFHRFGIGCTTNP